MTVLSWLLDFFKDVLRITIITSGTVAFFKTDKHKMLYLIIIIVMITLK